MKSQTKEIGKKAVSLDEDIQKKIAQSFVLLLRQNLLIKNLVSTQKDEVLGRFERAIKEETQSINEVLGVFNFVFSLIDHLARFQKIAASIPGISKKSKEFRTFVKSLSGLKDRRNLIQHIDNNIENDFSGPLLGSVCWCKSEKQIHKQYLAGFFDVSRHRTIPQIPFDTDKGEFTSSFAYIYDDKHYDLNAALDGVEKFIEHVQKVIILKTSQEKFDIEKEFLAYCITLSKMD